MTMEEMLHFFETDSHYMFHGDVLEEHAKELWLHLVALVDHYCRPGKHTYSEQSMRAARDRAFAYARKLEEIGSPAHLFTYNLHLTVCR